LRQPQHLLINEPVLALEVVMAQRPDLQLAESLFRFNPKWWWDPIPPWFSDHLTVEVARELTRIQLNKQLRILEVEQAAVKETLNIIQKVK
jgi:hypothetical protein